MVVVAEPLILLANLVGLGAVLIWRLVRVSPPLRASFLGDLETQEASGVVEVRRQQSPVAVAVQEWWGQIRLGSPVVRAG